MKRARAFASIMSLKYTGIIIVVLLSLLNNSEVPAYTFMSLRQRRCLPPIKSVTHQKGQRGGGGGGGGRHAILTNDRLEMGHA